MTDQPKTEVLGDLILKLLYPLINKLHHPSTVVTHDVVVVILSTDDLEPANTIAKIDRGDQLRLTK